ncbi:MAG: HAD family hydrolase [Actinomycetota bacterium]
MFRAVLKRWWWLSLLIVGASACQGSFDVVIMVNEDGSGEVATTTTISAEAADRLLDLEADANGIVLADLARSGWVVERPEVATDGATVITATKEFGTPEQFSEIMDELAGSSGPFRQFELVRTKSFGRVDYELNGIIDTTVDLGAFADDDLEDSLGRSIEAIAARYGAAEQQVSLSVLATLPGEAQGQVPTGLIATTEDQVGARWQARLADDRVQPISLATATTNVSPVVLIGVAVVAAVGAFLVVFSQVLRIVLPDRRRARAKKQKQRRAQQKKADAAANQRRDPVTGPIPVLNVEAGEEVRYRVVALDLMGVLYRQARDVEELLIPFVREKGAFGSSDEEIATRSRTLSLGRITTQQFWQAVGVEGDAAALDAEFMGRFQLTPGVIRYLRSLRADGKQVACLTNFAAGWAAHLKTGHSLEGLVEPWVVSGLVGVQKPDRAIFEVLRRVTNAAPAEIQVIDDDVAMLDAARTYGFGTVWFAPDGDRADANDHALIRSLETTDDDRQDAGSEP